jgi:hypothetical protein
MSGPPSIRILENDSNRRGDLFGRLMADLFIALGYDKPRLNIHKSGRELDLAAEHRLEPRRAIAECKATLESIGGADLNKFVGTLDAEHTGKDERPITGFFVSLNGFTETAIEQENNRNRTKIILLTGAQVIEELIKGRILIRKDAATELAGRCCMERLHLVLDESPELFAHDRGWIWAVYYTQGKERTHFALVHADGTLLARAIVDEIVRSDQVCGGQLQSLNCLNPSPPAGTDADPGVAEALAAYRRYLEEECGFIQLDGMPADNDIGSRRLRLESLFVPLNVDTIIAEEETERRSIGVILEREPRLAILASPGGGKSTLLKRLAVAYMDISRREQIADSLPSRDWLPVFFRCRELRSLARGSFAELLDALAEREPVRQYAAIFRAYLDRALLAGRILLLVDGLDEISDAGDRAAFVCTLRTALQAYPKTAIVVTSREAGFRHVAAHLASVCTEATLSPFDEDDILRLCVGWNVEVLGNTDKVRIDAAQLAADIVRSDRIRRLAVNPLLLTTLLLVKRWVGSLPTRRTVLYSKAVEVLLMTWNTEGHDPIPEEEALPQLCYIASAMMIEGMQKISRPLLSDLLQEARQSLPTELGYVKGTVEEFIHRIEDRSSLLMMTGHDVEDGRLVEFFEFRHLTFQEFLTARAMVEGWHPGFTDNDTLVSVLEPHFSDEKWREVFPLAAVLGGKASEALIQRLTIQVATLPPEQYGANQNNGAFSALAACLADEAAARPETIRGAISELVRLGFPLHNSDHDRMLAQGRYGAEFRHQARQAFLKPTPDWINARYALFSSVRWQTLKGADTKGYLDAANQFAESLKSGELIDRCEGALGLVGLCFDHRANSNHPAWAATIHILPQTSKLLTDMLFSESSAEQHVASWALGLLSSYVRFAPLAQPDAMGRLFALWQHSPELENQHLAAWAMARFALADRDEGHCASIPREVFKGIADNYEHLKDDDVDHEKTALLNVSWYLRWPWNDEELHRLAAALLREKSTEDDDIARRLDENTLTLLETLDLLGRRL